MSNTVEWQNGAWATSPDVLTAHGANGTVTFDGAFVSISRAGLRGRLTIGKGTKRIPLASITAVQWKSAGLVMSGFIQFTLGGGNEVRSRFGQQNAAASADENSVLFREAAQPAFVALCSAVEEAIVQRHRPATVAPTRPDVMAQLRQLAELRDTGVVTGEEFDAKKADLLGRL